LCKVCILGLNITSVKIEGLMDLRKKIGIALRITFLLGIWAMICLLSNDNRSYIKNAVYESVERINPVVEKPVLVRK